MRLFIAILLPETIRRHLQQTAGALRLVAPDVRWLPPENLHLTLKFLGHTDEPLVPKICAALQQIKIDDPIDLQVSGIQCFPPHGPLRIIAAALADRDSRCAALVEEIELTCEEFGFRRESRRYTPHITLARVKQSSPGLRQSLIAPTAAKFPGPAFNCDEFNLMESRLDSTGPLFLFEARLIPPFFGLRNFLKFFYYPRCHPTDACYDTEQTLNKDGEASSVEFSFGVCDDALARLRRRTFAG